MKRWIFFVTAIFCYFISANDAKAVTVSFSDTKNYWDGWTNSTKLNGVSDNNLDVIGNPNITGGTATTINGKLTSISFNYSATSYRSILPGDLFINILNSSNDHNWDYAVKTLGSTSAGNYSLYNLANSNISDIRPSTLNYSTSPYSLSGRDNQNYYGINWSGYLIRDDHPAGINLSHLPGLTTTYTAWFSGFDNSSNSNMHTSTYSFGNGIELSGNDFIIGWQMTCANDVLYERVKNPVPEPSTFILLFAGIAGLAIIRKRSL